MAPHSNRRCFVTVGSIASFRPLLSEILRPPFLSTLIENGFDKLEVQCGPDHAWFLEQYGQLPDKVRKIGLAVESFDYTTDMKSKMLHCRGVSHVREAGCVISHAGAGTVMEAIRYQVPLIVVPNPTLMDNHQAELADECESQGWAVHGRLHSLDAAIRASRQQAVQGRLDDLPPYAEPVFPVPEDQRVSVLDWMVLTSYPAELERQAHLDKIREPTGPEERPQGQGHAGGLRDLAGLQMD